MEQRDLFYRLRGAFREKGLLRGGRGARPLIGDDAGLQSAPHRLAAWLLWDRFAQLFVIKRQPVCHRRSPCWVWASPKGLQSPFRDTPEREGAYDSQLE